MARRATREGYPNISAWFAYTIRVAAGMDPGTNFITMGVGMPLPLSRERRWGSKKREAELGALLADLKFDPLVIGGLGALGYGAALLAHIVEEIREGVPLRIIPDALGAHYAGPEERHLPADRLSGRGGDRK